MLKAIEIVGKLGFSVSVGCAGGWAILAGAPLTGLVLIGVGVVSAFCAVVTE